MKRIAAVVSLLFVVGIADAADAQHRFRALLTGGQEVPPNGTESTGRFTMTVSADFTEARFTLSARDLAHVQRAHLHCNVAGMNGPIFIHLIGDLNTTTPTPGQVDVDGKWLNHVSLTNLSFTNTTTDCGDTLEEVVAAIRAGMVYVNIHTTTFPGGEIRGQLEEGLD